MGGGGDLRSGYWQISVYPQQQEKTAFVTPDGLWEFVRLPFGVTGGGGAATFQRAIEIVLSGLTYDTCLCYFDDIIIPSNSIQQQCERLTTVLSRFRTHNLRVKASKCTFAADQVLFLGHVVSSKGVHTDPAKIKAVSLLPEPKTVEQVRTFLGLAGYYRRFIPDFATIASPLVNLTKKMAKFAWDSQHQHAFHTLKSLLCRAPVLAYPNLNKQFILQTDASDLGLGAVLSQKDHLGKEHVIAYASRSFPERKKNYSVTEKEALAIIFAFNQFRVYLLGSTFLLVTDHSALRWLHSLEQKGRLGRWVMDLQEFSFNIQHRPGTSHTNADSLSCLSLSAPENGIGSDCEMGFLPACATTLAPASSLLDAQLTDPELSKVMELKSQGFHKPPAFVWAQNKFLRTLWNCWDHSYLQDELLVKMPDKHLSFPQYAFVIPKALTPSALQGIHSSPFSGHLGVNKSLFRARNRFYWPKMTVDIRDLLESVNVKHVPKLS